MPSIDFDPLARAVVVRWLIDRATGWTSTPVRLVLATIALGAVASFMTSGWVRMIGLVIVTLGLLAGLLLLVIRRGLLALVGRMAAQQNFGAHQAQADDILDEADLPTTPFAVARFVLRLRKGVGPEVVRLRAVIEALDDAIVDPFPDHP